MKVLKAVALLAIGFSLVGDGWCEETPAQVEAICQTRKKEPGLCRQSTATRAKCNYTDECHVSCNIWTKQSDCDSVMVNKKQHCQWHGPDNPKQGLCKAK